MAPYHGGGHLDHIVPRALGGSHAEHNLINVCATCNLRKGGRPLVDFAREFCYDYAAIAERLRGLGKSLEDKKET
jgi:5-methylcytosine-specific restriction endonuclease McrA